MSVLDHILALIAPHNCLKCNLEDALMCQACAATLAPPPSYCYRCGAADCTKSACGTCQASLEALWAVTSYEKHGRQLVHYLKYERAYAAARSMAELMAAVCPEYKGWVVTYAPTTPSRRRQRGYDQAQLLAKSLAKEMHLPSLDLLARVTKRHQVGRSGSQRRKQMKGAFRTRTRAVVNSTKILLVDDVITTGSTLDEAARTLRDAGASQVEAVVFARA